MKVLLIILRTNIYQVDLDKDGDQGFLSGLTNKYNLMLAKLNGFEVLKCLRKDSFKTSIMKLTARDPTIDKINGLDCGADDYLS